MIALLPGCSDAQDRFANAAPPEAVGSSLVEARGKLAGNVFSLDLRNTGREPACFYSAMFPEAEYAFGFRIFTGGGEEREMGDLGYFESGGDVIRLQPGARMNTKVQLDRSFLSAAEEGDCILVEIVHHDCRAASEQEFEIAPLSGIVQRAWRVQQGSLVSDESAASCLSRSRLIWER
jgi:hypothetical protein